MIRKKIMNVQMKFFFMINSAAGFLLGVFFCLIFLSDEAHATWCVAGNSNQGAITPTTVSQNTANVNPSGKVPYWSFAGTAGVTYYFSLCASANTEDAVLNVYNGASPSGALIAANDEGVCPSKSSLSFICPANGTYYVAANLYPWFQFATTSNLRLTYYICGATAGASLPYTENWTTSDVTTACTGWVAHGAGGEGDWYINYSSSPIPGYSANEAGGTGNEVGFIGNQADLYGVDLAQLVTLTSPKLNTTSVTSMTFSWKQTLGVTNENGDGSPITATIKLQSSSDLINWTDRYTATYPTTASLTTPVFKSVQSVTFNPASNDTWLRFYCYAEPYKIWGWFIDNGGITTMPVELLSFTGENNGKQTTLNWQTASEKDNDYFTVEASPNPTEGGTFEWKEIGRVNGAGNSSTIKDYEFIDKQVLTFVEDLGGVIYYRLKQTDYDGMYKYYGPIAVNSASTDDWNLLFKNPIEDEMLVGTLLTKENTTAQLEIIDLQGRIILKEKIVGEKGINQIQIDLRNAEPGTYFIKINNEKNFVIKRFVKL